MNPEQLHNPLWQEMAPEDVRRFSNLLHPHAESDKDLPVPDKQVSPSPEA